MRSLLCVFALLAPGCPSNGDDGQIPAEVEVDIGTGTVEFEPLAEGDELSVVAGPQGGFHFHVHARMSGLAPGDPSMPGLLENPATTFAAFRESGEQIDFGFPPYRLGYVGVGDGQFELPSGRILQIIEDRVPAIYGERIRLTVTVSDDRGRSGAAEATVVAVESTDTGPADAGAVDAGK